MPLNCYICDQTNNIALYYILKPDLYFEPSYIDPKFYTQPITEDLKPICEKCLIPFVLERQMGYCLWYLQML